jgi:hypothetical protein
MSKENQKYKIKENGNKDRRETEDNTKTILKRNRKKIENKKDTKKQHKGKQGK